MKRLGSICARGGSKGVKGKNWRMLMGKPLIAHTIEDVRNSGMFDAIAVSSDSPEILEVAEKWAVDYVIRRPDELATDAAGKTAAIFHCAQQVEAMSGLTFDTFADMDATAPLRVPQDIVEAIEFLEASDHGNIFSVCRSRRSPYFNMAERHADGRVTLAKSGADYKRRQDVPETFDINASIYAWKRDCFFETKASVFTPTCGVFVMPEHSLFDVDSEFDFELVEMLAPRVRGQSSK